MKALSPEESWILFCKKTFQEKERPRHLVELSERILGRCEGLPLAIVAIAGVLASKDYNRVDEWELVNRSLGAEVEGSDMMKILLLSYNDLPYYLKSCFLYLSIFPEDHLIGWMSLIRLWVAEGFVEVKHGKTSEEVAEAYIYELLNRSLIQVAKRRRDGRIQSCRIHDLLREIIVSKSIDQNFLAITGAGNVSWLSKVRHLSIHNTLQNIPQGKCFSRLRSLFMFGVDDPLFESSTSLMFNGGLRLLKVLNLRGASLKTFPNQIVKLFHLRYLCLRGTQVRVLPNSIGKLQNLEALDLKGMYVTELPTGILRLQQLRYLLLYHTETDHFYYHPFDNRHGFKAPSKIGHLQSLQKLCYIETNNVSDNTILKEIGQLTQLRRLGIRKLRREDGVALCSSIEKLSNLRSLDITPTKEDEILNLQSLSRAPQFLQRLYLNGRLEKLPDWITSLYGLTTIFLRWSKLMDDPLESLQDLPNLCRLELVHAYEREGLCFKAGKFQSLKQLGLTSLEGLRWVTVEESAMPRLENLLIADCKLVEELPFGIEHLSNLKHLELVDLSDELVSKLNPSLQGGEYCKIAHIPTLWIAHSKDGCWKKYY
ncbi:disease resistance protein RPM1-like [Camellia sinensis]|uniref:disease resistance protein RPM1-like n=1 Tax=Camellia sinensis TaxID=4442 RepID=UPI00103681FD|nr:disease resistance protein RPM1-like [Camellia sinensis]